MNDDILPPSSPYAFEGGYRRAPEGTRCRNCGRIAEGTRDDRDGWGYVSPSYGGQQHWYCPHCISDLRNAFGTGARQA